jgi:hypothetical protein
MNQIKAQFETFDELLADPSYAVVADFWRRLLTEYDKESPLLPIVWPCDDSGFSLIWDDGFYHLDVKLGSKDDDGWFFVNHNTGKYKGSIDHETNIDIINFAKLLRETPWEFTDE